MTRLFMTFLALLMLAGCGSSSSTSAPTGGGGSASGIFPASGSLTFTGADTANIGVQVVAGYIVPVAATASSPASAIITDSGNSILSASNSSGDGFYMTVADGVSSVTGNPVLSVMMLVTVGGVDYDYTCGIILSSGSINDCGAGKVTLDITNRIVKFDGASMVRIIDPVADTYTTITVDGEIRW